MRTTAIAAAALLTAVTARDWVALAAARAAADEPRACGPNCMDLRTPYLESSGWGAARYCAAPPCFVVRRLSKTGGSFLSGVVERVVARRRRAVIKDDVPVPCAYRSNASLAASFFVGVVRNPCEFYASLAQDVPEQAFAEPYGAAEPWFRGPVVTKAELRATRPQRNGSGPAPAALRAWLDATLRGDLGYFSYHFWVSYVRNECVDTDMTASDGRAPCPRDACAPEDFARDAAAVDAAALADCWLRTETLLLEQVAEPFGDHAGSPGLSFLQPGAKLHATAAVVREIAARCRRGGGSEGAAPYFRSDPAAGLLSAAQRAALRSKLDRGAAVDGALDFNELLTRREASSRLGAKFCASLEALFAAHGGRVDAVALRRSAAVGQCIRFHADENLMTLQVCLNDDFDGGDLVYLADDCALVKPRRPAGSYTVHNDRVVHGVSTLVRGVRYALLLLMRQP